MADPAFKPAVDKKATANRNVLDSGSYSPLWHVKMPGGNSDTDAVKDVAGK